MPLYTGDYLRDTLHLSCSEHGIYLKLLMHCWDQKGPAPLDEHKLMGIVNARSGDEIEAMRRVLGEFFVCMDDGYYNQRMQREIERRGNISGNPSAAGKKSYAHAKTWDELAEAAIASAKALGDHLAQLPDEIDAATHAYQGMVCQIKARRPVVQDWLDRQRLEKLGGA